MELSLSSAFKYRRSQESDLTSEALDSFATEVKKKNAKVFVKFDGKKMKQDIDGEKSIVERLAIKLYSPALQQEQLLGAFPLDSGTGEAMAEAIYGELLAVDLHDHVMGIMADTTASNFGMYRGAIKILQVSCCLTCF